MMKKISTTTAAADVTWEGSLDLEQWVAVFWIFDDSVNLLTSLLYLAKIRCRNENWELNYADFNICTTTINYLSLSELI